MSALVLALAAPAPPAAAQREGEDPSDARDDDEEDAGEDEGEGEGEEPRDGRGAGKRRPEKGKPTGPLELDPELMKAIEAMIEERVAAEVEARMAAGASEKVLDEKLDEKLAQKKSEGFFTFEVPRTPVKFDLRGDFFTKFLARNNQSGGCVTYGNPAPEGDNFAGDNGICSELALTFRGYVSDRVEVGARLASRYGAQWANWWENGDLKLPGLDGSGESLGMNHAAYIQLRGLYLRAAPPIPTVKAVHLGASDLGMFNPWTVGKIRFTERDNARGIFVEGEVGGPWLQYTLARIALPKLWASAGYNTGIDDPLVQNPFWERDAAYAYKLASEWDWFRLEQITSYVLDEEADLDDPDAIGSTNTIDGKDGVVVTNPRYQNLVSTFQAKSDFIDWLNLTALGGYSFSATHPDHVFNSVSGSQGFTPVPMGFHPFGYTAVARADFFLDPLIESVLELMEVEVPFETDLELHFEYFNIGAEWVSVMGARREADVLLTDGFLDGQVPTLNVANEFQDFTEPFYESIIGWHGVTGVVGWTPWTLELFGELTFIEYNTDTGDVARDTHETYPDFLYTDGMTDTELYSYANTNDRGRDPRSVYHEYQNRRTVLGVFKGAYTLDLSSYFEGDWTSWTPPVTLRVKQKTIWDTDLRNPRLEGDDYNGLLFFNRGSIEMPVTDELSGALGVQVDVWSEAHRSGDVIAGVADYPDYFTIRQKAFLDVRYVWGGISLWYHLEYLNKWVNTSDPRLNYSYSHILRTIAMVSATF